MIATDLLDRLDDFLESVAPLRRKQLLAPHIARAKVAIGKVFLAQGALYLARFAALHSHFEEADDGTIDAALAAFALVAIETAHLLADPINDLAASSLQTGATETLADLAVELSFDLSNPRAVQYLLKYGALRVTQIDQTTRDQLRTLLANGVDQGLSYDQIAAQIQDLFAGFSADRALVIATYEAGTAYSEGTLIVGQDLQAGGLEMEKSWLTAQDSAVDPDLCGPNEDQGWIPLDDQFQSGDDRPLAHPRCRCVLLTRRVGSDG
jgi:hypothetical protein